MYCSINLLLSGMGEQRKIQTGQCLPHASVHKVRTLLGTENPELLKFLRTFPAPSLFKDKGHLSLPFPKAALLSEYTFKGSSLGGQRFPTKAVLLLLAPKAASPQPSDPASPAPQRPEPIENTLDPWRPEAASRH